MATRHCGFLSRRLLSQALHQAAKLRKATPIVEFHESVIVVEL